MRLSLYPVAIGVAVLLFAEAATSAETAIELEDVRKIWDRDPHSAFTDLIRFKDQWFCSFRVGAKHVSADGAIQVLKSTDGLNWSPAARIQSSEADLRDPKLSITPDGRLMITGAASWQHVSNPPIVLQSQAWFSDDGEKWSEPTPIGDPNVWLWRTTWHQGTAYTIGYSLDKKDRSIRIYQSRDGKNFTVLADRLVTDAYPNEATLRFNENGIGYCLLRREGGDGLLGTSKTPYAEWQWQDVGTRIGGPELFVGPGDRMLATVRLYQPKVRTAVGEIDRETGKFSERLTLPSSGDCSYAGMKQWNDRIWMSYYSSHEGRTAIYFARLKVTPK